MIEHSEQRERARLAALPRDPLLGNIAWQHLANTDAHALPHAAAKPDTDSDAKADAKGSATRKAVVVGGGVVGALTALRLAARLGPVSGGASVSETVQTIA